MTQNEHLMLTLNIRRTADWKSLYELQAVVVVLFLAFIPVVGAAVEFWGSAVMIPVAALHGGTLLFVQRKTIDWKCPRCEKAFLRNKGDGFAIPFRRRCGNCGLKRGTSK